MLAISKLKIAIVFLILAANALAEVKGSLSSMELEPVCRGNMCVSSTTYLSEDLDELREQIPADVDGTIVIVGANKKLPVGMYQKADMPQSAETELLLDLPTGYNASRENPFFNDLGVNPDIIVASDESASHTLEKDLSATEPSPNVRSIRLHVALTVSRMVVLGGVTFTCVLLTQPGLSAPVVTATALAGSLAVADGIKYMGVEYTEHWMRHAGDFPRRGAPQSSFRENLAKVIVYATATSLMNRWIQSVVMVRDFQSSEFMTAFGNSVFSVIAGLGWINYSRSFFASNPDTAAISRFRKMQFLCFVIGTTASTLAELKIQSLSTTIRVVMGTTGVLIALQAKNTFSISEIAGAGFRALKKTCDFIRRLASPTLPITSP